MIFLILAILSSTAVSVVMRLSEKHIRSKTGMLMMNYIVCSVLAFALIPAKENLPQVFSGQNNGSFALWLGLINGFLYLVSFMLLQWNVSHNGVVLSALFMKLGILVPIVVAMIVFRETPGVLQWVGIAAALAAILIMNLGKGQSLGKAAPGLIALLVIGGGGDALSKVYEQLGNAEYKDAFLLFTFFSALLLCTLFWFIRDRHFSMKDALFGVLIGVPNYLSARFLLHSLESVPAVVAYPTYSAATIILITGVGVLAFKEKLNSRKIIGLVIILAALVLLNL